MDGKQSSLLNMFAAFVSMRGMRTGYTIDGIPLTKEYFTSDIWWLKFLNNSFFPIYWNWEAVDLDSFPKQLSHMKAYFV